MDRNGSTGNDKFIGCQFRLEGGAPELKLCAIFQNEVNLRLQVDGNKLAAGLGDGTVVVWNEDGTKSFEIKQHSDWIISIRWNGVEEKSHLFVTGSLDEVNNLQIE